MFPAGPEPEPPSLELFRATSKVPAARTKQQDQRHQADRDQPIAIWLVGSPPPLARGHTNGRRVSAASNGARPAMGAVLKPGPVVDREVSIPGTHDVLAEQAGPRAIDVLA